MRVVRPTQRSGHAKDAAEKGAEGPGAPLHHRALHPGSDDLVCLAEAQPGEHQQSPHLQQHFCGISKVRVDRDNARLFHRDKDCGELAVVTVTPVTSTHPPIVPPQPQSRRLTPSGRNAMHTKYW